MKERGSDMKKLLLGFLIGVLLMLSYCVVLWCMFEKSSLFGPESDEVKQMKNKIKLLKARICKK